MAMPAYVPAPFPCPLEGCNVFPYETSADLATHMATHFADSTGTPATVITSRPGPAPVITSRPQVVGSGRFVQVNNGFGGTTTKARPKVANPPTTTATNYLRKLLDERRGIAAAEELRRQLNDARQAGALTASLVSGAITQAQRIRKR